MAYKWSTGSETGTFSVTQATTVSGHAAMILLSIAGAHASTPPEAGSRAVGTSSSADPASFDPSGWGAEDTLWIAVCGNGETSTGGSWLGISGNSPSGFSGDVKALSTADTVGAVDGAVGFLQANAASEDVSTWNQDNSNTRNVAVVVAVRPAPSTRRGRVSWAQLEIPEGAVMIYIPRNPGVNFQDPALV